MLHQSVFQNFITSAAIYIELFGVLVIVGGGAIATFQFFKHYYRHRICAYKKFRGDLGHGILLGLEFLVAGDIVGTVAVTPTFESLGTLAVVVLIRTFLSFSLELEINGHWPWQRTQFAVDSLKNTEKENAF